MNDQEVIWLVDTKVFFKKGFSPFNDETSEVALL